MEMELPLGPENTDDSADAVSLKFITKKGDTQWKLHYIKSTLNEIP